jgi:hypothetical protein
MRTLLSSHDTLPGQRWQVACVAHDARNPSMLTRSEVAKRLGKSIATVRRMEGRELQPQIDGDGVHLFDPAEVEDVARARRANARSLEPSQASDWRDWLEDTRAQREHESQRRAKEEHELRAEELARNARAERQRAEDERIRVAADESRQRDQLRAEAFEFVGSLTPREVRQLARQPEFQEFLAELDAD